MRVERVVINASPLITLFRSGLHPLLPQLFPDLAVPAAVWAFPSTAPQALWCWPNAVA
jgi:hypothetical protein